MLEPYYDSYVAMIQMAGGVRRPVTLRAPDFRLDTDELRAAVTDRTRFVLLNSPHNPTGCVLTRAELDGRRRGRDRARPGGDHRRGLRAPDLRRRAHAAGDPAGHVGAHPDAVQRRQVLLVHGLEGRLGDRAGRARRRGARREAVADVHLGLAAPAGGRGRPRRPRRLPDSSSPPTCTSAATCSATGCARPGSSAFVPDGTYFASSDVSAPRLEGRHGVLPRPARAGRRRRDPGAGVLRRQPTERPGATSSAGRSARSAA